MTFADAAIFGEISVTFAVTIVETVHGTGDWCRAVARVSVAAVAAAAPVCTLPLGERQFGAHAAAAAVATIHMLDANATFDGRAAADAERRPTAAATHYLYCITQIGWIS